MVISAGCHTGVTASTRVTRRVAGRAGHSEKKRRGGKEYVSFPSRGYVFFFPAGFRNGNGNEGKGGGSRDSAFNPRWAVVGVPLILLLEWFSFGICKIQTVSINKNALSSIGKIELVFCICKKY